MSQRESPLKAQGLLGAERCGSNSPQLQTLTVPKPSRRRSGAVRFGSKKQADDDVLLVKANREELQELKGHDTMCGAVSSLQGWRKAMEDRHALFIAGSEFHSVRRIGAGGASPAETPPDSPNHRPTSPAGTPLLLASPEGTSLVPPEAAPEADIPVSDSAALDTDTTRMSAFLGIYDGHNGTTASAFCGSSLHRVMARIFAQQCPATDDDIARCCKVAFQECDDALRAAAGTANGGSTAACAVVLPERIVLCSAGDCRCAVVSKDSTVRVAIADDHTARNPAERARLERDGIPVLNDRVRGVLGVTRALGDFALKPVGQPHAVIATPEVVVVPREESDAAVFIGCDGVWETQALPAVAKLVAGDGASGVSAVTASSCSVERPMAPGGGLLPGSDNVSLGAIFFSSPFEED